MQTIPIVNLLVMLLPICLVGVFYALWLGRRYEVGYAALRMIAQLLLVGYVLTYIFDHSSSWLSLGILLLMIVVSSAIALRSLDHGGWQAYGQILVSILIAGGINLGLVIFVVIQPSPWYEGRVLIPLAGMIFANGMNAVSLGAERYEKERDGGFNHVDARSHAFRAAMIPQVNSFLAVGLVSLPGMMTGQILSGVSPLIAVRYQVMVMAMVFGTAGIGLITYFLLEGRKAATTA